MKVVEDVGVGLKVMLWEGESGWTLAMWMVEDSRWMRKWFAEFISQAGSKACGRSEADPVSFLRGSFSSMETLVDWK